MTEITATLNYVLSFKPYVILPIIIFILSLIFRIKLKNGIKAAMTMSIGFIGIFTMLNFFVSVIGPALETLVKRTGLKYNVLDVGWPPLATMAWGFKLAAVILIILIIFNGFLVILNFTDTINIDIWNYWHFIFMGCIVYDGTKNYILSILAAMVADFIALKIADYSAKGVQDMIGMTGISTPTLSVAVYYPYAKILNKVIDKIPILNKIEADPESIQKKLGLFGEPMVIGFLLGGFLGAFSGYDVKNILQLAFSVAAVVYILPEMCSILTKGIMPISEGMKDFLHKKAPNLKDKYIGLDIAIILGNPAVVVSGLLIMPIAFLLAFIVPGVNFIPLGDLPNSIGLVALIVVASKGNVVRSVIISIPIIIADLIIASNFAQIYTSIAKDMSITFTGYSGTITSFYDGGNVFRFWLLRVFEGKLWALIFIPIMILLLYYSRSKPKVL
ncbi:MAG TPA: PTS transporter subunit IIC [Clostridiaceae bacterium]